MAIKKYSAAFALPLAAIGMDAVSAQDPETDLCEDNRYLHTASPDWRDQVIYFLMIDRFDDGDPSNNDQGLGEYDPADGSRYSGGDLKGVIDRMDYIQGLGATAVWTTPPVANQWWSTEAQFSGYHGYWARDFTRVDEHYGTMQDLKNLSCTLHKRKMYHVMDIVVNHTGDFFDYDKSAITHDPETGFRATNPGSPSSAPERFPFNLNDPRRAEDKDAKIYNWTGELFDYYDRHRELTEQLANLDDIDTTNPVVRTAFKNIFGDWIRNTGIDAFRVDTVKYVEPQFFQDFIHADDGILAQAKKTGREDFLLFGEVKENAPKFSIAGEAKMDLYYGLPSKPIFPSLINFPLQEEMIRVLAQGQPTSAMTYRFNALKLAAPDPTLTVNFVDNHDVPRFLSQGSLAAFKQAMALMFTSPGIPVLYQGNAQAHVETRRAMFAGGHGSKTSQFDTSSEMYRFIQEMAKIRREHPALTRGDVNVLADNPILPGVFAFRRDKGENAVFVILNTSDTRTLLAGMPTGLKNDSALKPVFGSDAVPILSSDGSLTLELGPREILIFSASTSATFITSQASTSGMIAIETPLPTAPLTEPFTISGRYGGPEKALDLVIDGDLNFSQAVPVDDEGRWTLTLAPNDVGTHDHIAQLYAGDSGLVSQEIAYTTQRQDAEWSGTFADPANDDSGIDGALRAPTDPSFDGRFDILSADMRHGGDILEMKLTMKSTAADWHPSNGFDHVSITTFFDFPNEAGLDFSQDISAPMPEGFNWSAMHTVFGWGNSLSRAPDKKLGRAPNVTADLANNTITIHYSASALGIESWDGVRLYVTTFDREGEGGFRKTTNEGGPMAFRGDPDGPKIMDDMLIAVP
ncbi:MAG: alpha-amylase family glycosyl hydrolase [Pseudomonadota bacterium]